MARRVAHSLSLTNDGNKRMTGSSEMTVAPAAALGEGFGFVVLRFADFELSFALAPPASSSTVGARRFAPCRATREIGAFLRTPTIFLCCMHATHFSQT